MSNQEAIKIFERYIDNECYKESFQNACKLAIESIKRVAPKKPIVDYAGEFMEVTQYYCPNCYMYLDNTEGEVMECSHCNQELDWRSEQ